MYRAQISIDCQARRSVSIEARELGMMFVAFGLAAQDSLCQQSLSPQRHQTL